MYTKEDISEAKQRAESEKKRVEESDDISNDGVLTRKEIRELEDLGFGTISRPRARNRISQGGYVRGSGRHSHGGKRITGG